MLRFALDEVNRPVPNDPTAVFHRFGMAPPMWAILNDTPTPDEHAQYQSLLAQVLQQRAGTGNPMVNLAAENASAAPAAEPENVPAGTSPAPNGIAQAGTPKINAGGRAPGLYVTGHPVFGVGPEHTAIEYVDENGNSQWLSAGPGAGSLKSGLGQEQLGERHGVLQHIMDRITGKNRPGDPDWRYGDAPEHNVTLGRITPPAGSSDKAYFGYLNSIDAGGYRDNLPYQLFPETGGGYNSNGYVRGMIEATGGTADAPLDRYVGGNRPVPPLYFTSPGNLEAGFSLDMSHQPAPLFRRVP